MKSSKPLVTLMVIMLLVVPLIASCGTQSTPIDDPGADESPLDSTGDESDQENGPEDIEMSRIKETGQRTSAAST